LECSVTTLSVSVRECEAGEPPGESLTVVVAGELDIATAPRFSACLRELLHRDCPRELVVNLSGVTFMDATGLRALTDLRRRAEQRESALVLEGVPPRVHRVLELIGPARRFRIRG
jgi:anti-sigma B factor antagonist